MVTCDNCNEEFESEFEYIAHNCPEDDLQSPNYS